MIESAGRRRALSRPRGLPSALALLFLLYAVVGVTGIAVLMPPLQAADELAHAQRAAQIGRLGLLGVRSADGLRAGGITPTGPDRLSEALEPLRFHHDRQVDAAMRQARADTGWGAPVWQDFPNTALYPPVFYLPAALGLDLGRWSGLSVWHGVVGARLLTGLVSIMLATAAIALAGRAATLLFAILCLPMSLALFAAISQDGPMIAAAALACALLARAGPSSRSFALGCALLSLVAMGRPVYLPLGLFALLSPDRSWRLRLSGIACLAAPVLLFAWTSGRLIMPAASAAQIAAQMAAIRQHPLSIVAVAGTTLRVAWRDGLPVGREFIGVLGWLDTPLPLPYYAIAGAVLILAATLSGLGGSRPRRSIACLAVLAATALVYGVQYLSWSPIAGPTVEGVQGRYFLPIAPFLAWAIPSVGLGGGADAGRRLPERAALLLTAAFPALSLAVTLRAVVLRYYGG